jgi:hypothetical protein
MDWIFYKIIEMVGFWESKYKVICLYNSESGKFYRKEKPSIGIGRRN